MVAMVPIVSSADDLDAAIRFATLRPTSRWYVVSRARALGRPDLVPVDWGMPEAATVVADATPAEPAPITSLTDLFAPGQLTDDEFVGLTAASIPQIERDKLASEGVAMEDGSFPIRNREELEKAINLRGSGNQPKRKVIRHIRKRAKALGCEDALPEGLTAAIGRKLVHAAEGAWDDALHPRGHDGKFIDKNGEVQLIRGGKAVREGKAVGVRKDPHGPGTIVTLKTPDGRTQEFLASQLQNAPTKRGHIGVGDTVTHTPTGHSGKVTAVSDDGGHVSVKYDRGAAGVGGHGTAPVHEVEKTADAPKAPDKVVLRGNESYNLTQGKRNEPDHAAKQQEHSAQAQVSKRADMASEHARAESTAEAHGAAASAHHDAANAHEVVGNDAETKLHRAKAGAHEAAESLSEFANEKGETHHESTTAVIHRIGIESATRGNDVAHLNKVSSEAHNFVKSERELDAAKAAGPVSPAPKTRASDRPSFHDRTQRLELHGTSEGKGGKLSRHDKFYESSVVIHHDNTASHVIRFGSTKHEGGTVMAEHHPDVQAALDAHHKKAGEKEGKGYETTGGLSTESAEKHITAADKSRAETPRPIDTNQLAADAELARSKEALRARVHGEPAAKESAHGLPAEPEHVEDIHDRKVEQATEHINQQTGVNEDTVRDAAIDDVVSKLRANPDADPQSTADGALERAREKAQQDATAEAEDASQKASDFHDTLGDYSQSTPEELSHAAALHEQAASAHDQAGNRNEKAFHENEAERLSGMAVEREGQEQHTVGADQHVEGMPGGDDGRHEEAWANLVGDYLDGNYREPPYRLENGQKSEEAEGEVGHQAYKDRVAEYKKNPTEENHNELFGERAAEEDANRIAEEIGAVPLSTEPEGSPKRLLEDAQANWEDPYRDTDPEDIQHDVLEAAHAAHAQGDTETRDKAMEYARDMADSEDDPDLENRVNALAAEFGSEGAPGGSPAGKTQVGQVPVTSRSNARYARHADTANAATTRANASGANEHREAGLAHDLASLSAPSKRAQEDHASTRDEHFTAAGLPAGSPKAGTHFPEAGGAPDGSAHDRAGREATALNALGEGAADEHADKIKEALHKSASDAELHSLASQGEELRRHLTSNPSDVNPDDVIEGPSGMSADQLAHPTNDREYANSMIEEASHWDVADYDLEDDEEPDEDLRSQMDFVRGLLNEGKDKEAADAADHLKGMIEIGYDAHKNRDEHNFDYPIPERPSARETRTDAALSAPTTPLHPELAATTDDHALHGISKSAENKGIGMGSGEIRGRVNNILHSNDHEQAHRDLAKVMSEAKLGGKQRARYREILNEHHGNSGSNAPAGSLRDDNELRDRLSAAETRAAKPTDQPSQTSQALQNRTDAQLRKEQLAAGTSRPRQQAITDELKRRADIARGIQEERDANVANTRAARADQEQARGTAGSELDAVRSAHVDAVQQRAADTEKAISDAQSMGAGIQRPFADPTGALRENQRKLAASYTDLELGREIKRHAAGTPEGNILREEQASRRAAPTGVPKGGDVTQMTDAELRAHAKTYEREHASASRYAQRGSQPGLAAQGRREMSAASLRLTAIRDELTNRTDFGALSEHYAGGSKRGAHPDVKVVSKPDSGSSQVSVHGREFGTVQNIRAGEWQAYDSSGSAIPGGTSSTKTQAVSDLLGHVDSNVRAEDAKNARQAESHAAATAKVEQLAQDPRTGVRAEPAAPTTREPLADREERAIARQVRPPSEIVDEALRDSGNSYSANDPTVHDRIREALQDVNPGDEYITIKPPGGSEVDIRTGVARGLLAGDKPDYSRVSEASLEKLANGNGPMSGAASAELARRRTSQMGNASASATRATPPDADAMDAISQEITRTGKLPKSVKTSTDEDFVPPSSDSYRVSGNSMAIRVNGVVVGHVQRGKVGSHRTHGSIRGAWYSQSSGYLAFDARGRRIRGPYLTEQNQEDAIAMLLSKTARPSSG